MALKVLVADDQPGLVYIIDLIVKEAGHISTLVTNGKDAVSWAEADKYDLIFLDIRMPYIDGITAMKKIRTFDQHAMIIIMTAYHEATEEEILNLGASIYLQKPFDIEQVREIIRKCEHSSGRTGRTGLFSISSVH
ncbi:MAG: response regulator [Gammaproteobacteria bacterium]|nr:response regulator [Gammaproteobacteria bacterium]